MFHALIACAVARMIARVVAMAVAVANVVAVSWPVTIPIAVPVAPPVIGGPVPMTFVVPWCLWVNAQVHRRQVCATGEPAPTTVPLIPLTIAAQVV
jgi:hypothetical protein